MKKIILYFSLLLGLSSYGQLNVFTEDFSVNPFTVAGATATTAYPLNTGVCQQGSYAVTSNFNIPCVSMPNTPNNPLSAGNFLMVDNSSSFTNNTTGALLYENTFDLSTPCDSFTTVELGLRGKHRIWWNSIPDCVLEVSINFGVPQTVVITTDNFWHTYSFVVPNNLIQGTNTITVFHPTQANWQHIDYAIDDITIDVTFDTTFCCNDSVFIQPHGEYDCMHPDEDVPLEVYNSNGQMLTSPNYSFNWSNGQTTDIVFASIQDLPIWVTVVDQVLGCEYNDTFFVDCCPDSIFINYEGSEPCENPEDPFQLFVYDHNGIPLDVGVWQIQWSNGSGDNYVDVTLQDLPMTVVAYNHETGCEYAAVFNLVCCNEVLSIVPDPENPCENPNDPFQLYVFDNNNQQITQPDYSIQWSNGQVGDVINVMVTDMPMSVTVTNNETACVYTDTFTLDCCPDTVIIVPICLNPCDYPGLQIPFHATDGNGTVLTSPNYSFNWSNGATTSYTSASSAQLPLSVTVTDNVTGCVYSTTFTDPCCSTQISVTVLDPTLGPCNPQGWELQVINSLGTQLTSPAYSFAWSTGSTGQTAIAYEWTSWSGITVTVTDNSNGCQYTYTYVHVCINNIEESNEGEVRVTAAPNPSSDKIGITFVDKRVNREEIPKELVIYDTFGQVIYNGTISSNRLKQIDVADFTSGLYLYSIYENKQLMASDKFVKE